MTQAQYYLGMSESIAPGGYDEYTVTVVVHSQAVDAPDIRYTVKPDWASLNLYRYPIVEEPLTDEQAHEMLSSGLRLPTGPKHAEPEGDWFVALSAFGRNCSVTREEIVKDTTGVQA